jgi:hypothetical protein
MTEQLEINKIAENIFYLSPTLKIHSKECRHCRPDNEGWEQLESLTMGISQGYQVCRLCCPPSSEISETMSQPGTPVQQADLELLPESFLDSEGESQSENETPPLPESNPQSPSDIQASVEGRSPSNPLAQSSPKDQTEKKRYKILAGNGCHQAIAEVQAMLIRPSAEGDKFKLIFPDGLELDAVFKNPRLKWLAFNQDKIIGLHWFRGYPKMRDGKLVCFQIIAWDGDMPTSPQGWERWEFTGLWTPQKNLTVQRSMAMKEIRSIAKETGFIKKFKFSFSNAQDWIASKKLWIGYVYKLLCRREGDILKIQKVIPYACPRIKPSPKGKGKNTSFQSTNTDGEKGRTGEREKRKSV